MLFALFGGRVDPDCLETSGLAKGLILLQARASRDPKLGMAWVLLCLTIVNVHNLYRTPIVETFLPKAELERIIEEPGGFPLLHDLKIGAYVTFKLSDEDGKPLQLAAVDYKAKWISQKEAILAAGLEKLSPGWKNLFEELNPQTVLCSVGSPLYEFLSTNSDWHQNVRGEMGSKDGIRESSIKTIGSWAVFSRRV